METPSTVAMVAPAVVHDRMKASRSQIQDFCRRNQIHRLALFGSVLRTDFHNQSDIDVLMEFEPGVRVGFIGLASLELELSRLLGRKVDLRTPAELSHYFRNQVLDSALVEHE